MHGETLIYFGRAKQWICHDLYHVARSDIRRGVREIASDRPCEVRKGDSKSVHTPWERGLEDGHEEQHEEHPAAVLLLQHAENWRATGLAEASDPPAWLSRDGAES